METYKVYASVSASGFITVEAESKEEAERRVREKIEYSNGADSLDDWEIVEIEASNVKAPASSR